jgi:Uma2 family endonuclease
VATALERAAHNLVKMRVWLAVDAAVRAAGLPCQAFADGMTVEIGEDCDYEPDAVVNCGDRLPGDAVAVPNPVIVVEVLSASTQSTDNYLVLRADRPQIIHHRRSDDGESIETRVLADGAIRFDPPGFAVAISEFFPDD